MCVEQNEQVGEREEGKEGRGWGRSGRAWWAEERIWAFTPKEVEQDQVAVWRPGHRWEGTREEAVPWQVLAGLWPQAAGDGERQQVLDLFIFVCVVKCA